MASAKKPLFTKPSWATKSGKAASDLSSEKPTSIFSQGHIYEDILSEKRKHQARQAQRAKEREERERARSKDRIPGEREGESIKVGVSKRRRISRDQEDSNQEDDGQEHGAQDIGSSDDEFTTKKETTSNTSNRSTTPTKGHRILRSNPKKDQRLADILEHTSPAKNKPTAKATNRSNAILLDSDGEDEDENDAISDARHVKNAVQTTTAVRGAEKRTANKEQRSRLSSESDEEDNYVRELKRKAREAARLKKQGQGSFATAGSMDANTGLNSPSTHDPQGHGARAHRATSTPLADDPEVQIYIKTIIPGAKPLIVNRRASQPLDKVKQFWCERNELHPQIAAKMFFTWNGTRLYDSTTMRGLIELLKKKQPMSDGSDPSRGRIEIEAVTDEIFEHRQKQQERRRLETIGGGNKHDDHQQKQSDGARGEDVAGNEDEEAQQEQKSGVVVRLICPEIEAMNIRVRPHTSVSKLIAAFRKMRQIDSDKQIWLVYDGDRLENEQTADDIGFEHEDTIEVYLR